MRRIKLTQDRYALVDDDDYDYLSQFKWMYNRKRGYAVRNPPRILGYRKSVYMHREIVKAPSGFEIDHINNIKLDNRKKNLRICSHLENQRNLPLSRNKSGYRGVSWYKPTNKWRATIKVDKKFKHLGLFINIIDAAKAYDNAAKIYHGSFARLNFGQRQEYAITPYLTYVNGLSALCSQLD